MAKLSRDDALATIELLEAAAARMRALVDQDLDDEEAWWRTYVEEWAKTHELVEDVHHVVTALAATQGPLSKTAAARKGRVHVATVNRWTERGAEPLAHMLRRYTSQPGTV